MIGDLLHYAALIGFTLLLGDFIWRNLPRRGHAPALWSFPLIGSVPLLGDSGNIHVTLMNTAKRLGPVFSFDAGSIYTVALNGHVAIREALTTKSTEFAGRGEMYIERKVYNPENRGITFKQYGADYKNTRVLCMAALRQLGFGKHSVMEVTIQTEVEHFLAAARSKQGAAWYPGPSLGIIALNVVHQTLLGERFESGDPREVMLLENTHHYADCLDPAYDVLPLLTYLPACRRTVLAQSKYAAEYMGYFEQKVREALSSDNEDSLVHEFIKKAGASCDHKELPFIVRDFISDGTESASIALGWCLVLIGNHPEVQRRCQQELDAVVPQTRLPSLEDRAALPYLEATLNEVLRARTISPVAATHVTLCDTSVMGYAVPKGAVVVPNLYSCHMDPNVFPEPEKFRPERFLSENNQVVNKDLMAFSAGKRGCLGETLARQEMFLFTSSVLQQFNVLPPEGRQLIRDEGKMVIVFSPAEYELRLLPRSL